MTDCKNKHQTISQHHAEVDCGKRNDEEFVPVREKESYKSDTSSSSSESSDTSSSSSSISSSSSSSGEMYDGKNQSKYWSIGTSLSFRRKKHASERDRRTQLNNPLRRSQNAFSEKNTDTVSVLGEKDVLQVAIWGDVNRTNGNRIILSILNEMRNCAVVGSYKCARFKPLKSIVDVTEYRTEADMLYDPLIGAIVVDKSCVERSRCIRKAINAGKHVFVTSTPLACTVEQYEELAAALQTATKKRLVVSTMQPHRFDDAFHTLKCRIERESIRFGVPFSIQHDFAYSKPPENWKTERPLLIDTGARTIDVTHFLFGVPTSQLNFVTNNLRDQFQAFVENRYESNEISTHMVGSRVIRADLSHESVIVRFPRGSVTLDVSKQTLCVFDHERDSKTMTTAKSSDISEIYRRAMFNFVASVFGIENSYVTHDELLHTARFALVVQFNKHKLV